MSTIGEEGKGARSNEESEGYVYNQGNERINDE